VIPSSYLDMLLEISEQIGGANPVATPVNIYIVPLKKSAGGGNSATSMSFESDYILVNKDGVELYADAQAAACIMSLIIFPTALWVLIQGFGARTHRTYSATTPSIPFSAQNLGRSSHRENIRY
jgi:hypothetical protein